MRANCAGSAGARSGVLRAGGLVAGLVLAAQVATAREQAPPPASEPEEIVVRAGSRLASAKVQGPAPVTVLDAAAIARSGATSIGDLLNELPQLGSTFTLGNSTQYLGTAGLSLLDLRRLGTDRTLVLVNGRRHVGSNAGSTEVDVNTIPIDWIDRVEIITGGASAIYGADAVTGVVNIVLKNTIEGLKASAQYSRADDSGYNERLLSLGGGSAFAGQRGHAAFSLEYARQDRLRITERKRLAPTFSLLTNPADPDPFGVNNGIADNLLVGNAGLFFVNTGGVVIDPGTGQFLTFNPDGSARDVDFGPRADFSTLSCAAPCDFLDLNRYRDLQPGFDRYSLNTQARFALDDRLNLFFEGKYAETQARFLTQPSFDIGALVVRRDNAFLPAGLASLMDAGNLDAVPLYRLHADAGQRGEDDRRKTIRLVTGAEGRLAQEWSYEASAVYGRTAVDQITLNNRVNDRFYAASDAVRDPSSGRIVCRASLDPEATIPGTTRRVPDFARAGCVPTSVFGEGVIDAAARNFFNVSSLAVSELTQQVLGAFVRNPRLLALPAGGLSVVLGAEYRKERSRYDGDPLSQQGLTFLNAIASERGEYHVQEAFAELGIPVLAGLPGVERLELSAALRLSDYSTVGNTQTYKLGADWTVTPDLRLRGTRANAVRAPNVGELFGAPSQQFFDVDDPCSLENLDDALNQDVRRANCAALGVPDGFESQADKATISGVTGGNPEVQEERAHTVTLGLVITPRWVPGLVLTADYWRIRIRDAISAVDSQDILDRCVDDPGGIDNTFCALQARDPASGELVSIIQLSQNIQKLSAQGVDLSAAYVRRLGAGKLSASAAATYLDQLRSYPFQSEPQRFDEEAGEVGDPEWELKLGLVYDWSDYSLSWEARYIDNSLRIEQDILEANPDTQDDLYTGSVWYHDLQARWQAPGSVELWVGIDNLLQENPPRALLGTDNDSAIYDNVGRSYFVGLNWRP